MSSPTPRQPQPTPLPPGAPRHARTTPAKTDGTSEEQSQSVLQQRLQGAFLTVIGIAGMFGGVLFSIEAPRFTPVPVVFLTFWLVMVIVGKVLFTGLGKLRETGVSAPVPSQVRAAAAVAGIVIAIGMMGFAATSTGTGTAAAAPCPGGGPATCGPDPGAPTLTFTPPPAQTNAPGGQGGQQGGQDQNGIATSPASGGDNGPGIQAQTPQFGTSGQQAPNIPGNEQPGQGGQGNGQQPPQGQGNNGQGQQNQSPVRTTAPGSPQQTGQQTQPGQTDSGQPSSPTVTVTKTESQCAVAGAGNGPAGTPGGPGNGDSGNNGGGTGPDNGDGEQKDGAPSWAYLVGEVTALMTGRRGRKAGPLNKDGSAPTNKMVPGDQIDGENYKQWTTPDGDRTYILSENENAPSQYRFTLNQPPGGSSKVNDDGSVSVFDRDGNQVNRFDTPWAYDSVTGEKIPTRYSVDGDDLVQTIDRPEGNNNPILADPNPDGTPTLEESMAALSAPTTYGPYTPEQEAARATAAQAAEQQRITATLAQPVTQAQQPPMPDMATEIGKGIDQAEQQQVSDALMQPVTAVQQGDSPADPARLLQESLDQVTETQQQEGSDLAENVNELSDIARERLFATKVKPAQERADKAIRDAYMLRTPEAFKAAERARAELLDALDQFGALPSLENIDQSSIVRDASGSYSFNFLDEAGKVQRATIGNNGKSVTVANSLMTLFDDEGNLIETRHLDPGSVQDESYKWAGYIVDLTGAGKVLHAGGAGIARLGARALEGKTEKEIAKEGIGQLASSASARMANVRAVGAAGEKAAGIAKNTTRIPAPSGQAAYRIPDELSSTALGEVKNVKVLNRTPQMLDFIDYIKNNGLKTFDLYVRKGTGTRISQPMLDEIDALKKAGVTVNIHQTL